MITLDDARLVISAAEKRAQEIGQPMNITVLDPRLERRDSASLAAK
jgi:hypothetical protein